MRPLIFLYIIGSTVSAWVTGFFMRRRIRRALGRSVSNRELTSISTWIRVEEAEQRMEDNKPINPK